MQSQFEEFSRNRVPIHAGRCAQEIPNQALILLTWAETPILLAWLLQLPLYFVPNNKTRRNTIKSLTYP